MATQYKLLMAQLIEGTMYSIFAYTRFVQQKCRSKCNEINNDLGFVVFCRLLYLLYCYCSLLYFPEEDGEYIWNYFS